MLWANRFIASLAATILLLQVTAPAAVAAFEAQHGDKPPAHSAHHPGCPFDGQKNCPHHKPLPGEPSLVQCGDDVAITGITTVAFDATVTRRPGAFVSIGTSVTGPATIPPRTAYIATTPETPPPRLPTSL